MKHLETNMAMSALCMLGNKPNSVWHKCAPFLAPDAPAFCLVTYRNPMSIFTTDIRTAIAGKPIRTFTHNHQESKYTSWTEHL